MIEVPITVDDKEVMLRFRVMKTEEAAEWAAKIQARVSYKQGLDKAIELMEKIPAEDRDFDKYLAAVDKSAKLGSQVVKESTNIKSFVVEPEPKAVDKLFEEHPKILTDAFAKYFELAFPTEEDQKKS